MNLIPLMLLSLLCFQDVDVQKEEVDVQKGLELGTELLRAVNQNAATYRIEELLEEGASPNAATKDKVRPLMISSFFGNVKTTRLLLDRGAQVNGVDAKGNPALIYAVSRNRAESNLSVVSVLLSNGANVNTIAKNGDTPLLVLSRCHFLPQRAKEFGAIVDAGADVNAQDLDKRTPLMYLLALGSRGHDPVQLTPMIMKVLAKTPNLELRDKNGWTALDYAKKAGNTDWIQAIEKLMP